MTGISLFLFDNGKKISHKILIYKYKFYMITIIGYNVMFDTYTTYIHTKHNIDKLKWDSQHMHLLAVLKYAINHS